MPNVTVTAVEKAANDFLMQALHAVEVHVGPGEVQRGRLVRHRPWGVGGEFDRAGHDQPAGGVDLRADGPQQTVLAPRLERERPKPRTRPLRR